MGSVARIALPVGRAETHRLGMAEMGYRGLSEHWLMRRLGDVHWQLIADALGLGQAVFADASGRPVYAAFCALSFAMRAPDAPRLGDDLTLVSRLYSASATRLLSQHSLTLGGAAVGEVTMISTFVSHGTPGRNHSVARNAPLGRADLPPPPSEAARFAQSAAGLAREPAEPAAVTAHFTPCPATDFNAAGLLYFASYLGLADRMEWQAAPDLARRAATRQRVAVFLGNIDPGETVLSGYNPRPGLPGELAHSITLSRADGRALCRIITRKGL